MEADDLTVPVLKRTLLQEVGYLLRRDGSLWKEPILDVLRDLRHPNLQAVLFGGTLRSLLASRIFLHKPGRPRDIDVVVSGASLSQLEKRFADIAIRRTRFGGLRLQRGSWQFDVWPVDQTWAFKQDSNGRSAGFAELPATTPFNLEAVAVEVWSYRGRPRKVYSGDDRFFKGILSKTIELNRVDNPFPELTVVRGLVLAGELGFKIGPRLASYIRNIGASMDEDLIEGIQGSHYGHVRVDSKSLCDSIRTMVERSGR